MKQEQSMQELLKRPVCLDVEERVVDRPRSEGAARGLLCE